MVQHSEIRQLMAIFKALKYSTLAGGCWLRRLAKDHRGSPLLETIVAMAVFSTVGTALLAGLSTTHRSGSTIEIQSIAENITRNQMESIFNEAYKVPPATYTAVTSLPTGFTVTADAQEYVVGNTNVEKLVVTVTHEGNVIISLESLRTRP